MLADRHLGRGARRLPPRSQPVAGARPSSCARRGVAALVQARRAAGLAAARRRSSPSSARRRPTGTAPTACRRSGRRSGPAGRRPRRAPAARRRWRSASRARSATAARDAPREERGVDALGLVEAPGAQRGSTSAGCTRPRRGSGRRAPSTRTVSPRVAPCRWRRCPRTPTDGGAAASAPCRRGGGSSSSPAPSRQRIGSPRFLARGCAASYTFDRWPKSSLV